MNEALGYWTSTQWNELVLPIKSYYVNGQRDRAYTLIYDFIFGTSSLSHLGWLGYTELTWYACEAEIEWTKPMERHRSGFVGIL